MKYASSLSSSSAKSEYCQTEESVNSISTTISFNGFEEKNALVSFQKFVHFIQSDYTSPELKWRSNLKEEAYRAYLDKRRIIQKELQQFDYKDPLTLISHLYQKDAYSFELLIHSIRNINVTHCNNVTITAIIEEREKMEMISKIIEYYLHYITMNSSDVIINSLNRLNELESSVIDSHSVINSNKNKMKLIKKHFIEASAKMTLLKCKIENMKKTVGFIKAVLLKPISNCNKIKLSYYSYIDYYYANVKLMKSANQLIEQYPNANALIVLKGHCLDKERGLFNLVHIDIENMFEEKKHNVYDLWRLFNIDNQHGVSSDSLKTFVNHLSIIFNKRTKTVIKKACYNHSNNIGKVNYAKIKKIKQIALLKYDEESFVKCVKAMLLELKNMIEIYLLYTNSDNDSDSYSDSEHIQENNEYSKQLSQMLKDNQVIIYTIIEKKLSKFLASIGSILRHFGNRTPSLLIASMICLFEEVIKKEINIQYSKYLPLALRNLIIDNIKYTNMKNILKQGVLLSGDIWEKANLEENIDLLSMKKITQSNTLSLRNYLTIFNDTKGYVNHDTILTIFEELFSLNKYIHNDSNSNHSNNNGNDITEHDNNNNNAINSKPMSILSSPLNPSKLILSTSSINLVKAIASLIEELLFYDNIAFEIFYEIFNLVDYFFFSTLNMFIQNKSIMKSLIDKITPEDSQQQKVPHNYIDIQICNQSAYPNLKRFLISTKHKLEKLFDIQEGIDIENHCACFENSYDIKRFSLPQLNSVLLTSSNYDDNKVYNAIIAMESIHSIYKILKRLKHFTSKIDLEFQSDFIRNSVEKYKAIITEMNGFLYSTLSNQTINIDSVLLQISHSNYDISEAEVNDKLFETSSPFIEELNAILRDKGSKMKLLSKIRIKKQKLFYNEVLKFILSNMLNAFAKIQHCNISGRSLMLKDLKMLKLEIEKIMNTEWGLDINCCAAFQTIFTYINAWYYPKDAIFDYISNNKVEYNHWIGFMNSSPSIIELTRNQRKEFIHKVEEYYSVSLCKEIKRLNDL